MPEITESRLAEIEARASKATPGPWEFDSGFGYIQRDASDGMMLVGSVWVGDDGWFAAAARQDVPDLVREVRRLRSVTDAFTAFRSSVGAVIERRGCEGDTPDGSCADYTPHDLCDPCELQAAVNRLDADLRSAREVPHA